MLVGSRSRDIPDIETVIRNLALTLSDTKTIDMERLHGAMEDLLNVLQPFLSYSKESPRIPLIDTRGGAIFFIFYECNDYSDPEKIHTIDLRGFDVIYPEQNLIIRWTHLLPSCPPYINRYKNAGECPWLQKIFGANNDLWLRPLAIPGAMMRIPPDSPMYPLWRGFVDMLVLGAQRTGEEIFGMSM